MDYAVDATRAGDLLSAYLRRRKSYLQDQVSGVSIDVKLGKAVDEVCLLIADNLDHPIDLLDVRLRALLSARITVALAGFLEEPDAELYRVKARPSDEEVLAAVFRKVLPKVKLPREWDGVRLR